MKKPELSIIIPCLNEKNHLPKLLKSIKKQSFTNYEIVIADAGSTDGTLKLLKKLKLKVIKGGIPAIARNNGAKIAKGKFLLFVDADVILGQNILKNIVEILEKKPCVGTCLFKPLGNHPFDFTLHLITNIGIKLLKKSKFSNISGPLIFTTKELFQKVKGFNEKIRAGEDTHFVRKVSTISSMKIINTYSFVSVRRFESTSRIKHTLHLTLYNIKSLFGKYDSDYKYVNELKK